jgi:hypothetical protein
MVTPIALFIACIEVHCGLKYQHWPMKDTSFLARQVVSGMLYPYNSDKINTKKSETLQKLMFTATGWPTDVPLVVLG